MPLIKYTKEYLISLASCRVALTKPKTPIPPHLLAVEPISSTKSTYNSISSASIISSDSDENDSSKIKPNLWKPSRFFRADDKPAELEVFAKIIRSLLNKVTNENIENIARQIKYSGIDSIDKLQVVVDFIHEKAVSDDMFLGTYGLLCWHLATIHVLTGSERKISFRKLISKKCEQEFEKYLCNVTFKDENYNDEIFKAFELKAKVKYFNNILLIGELYREHMLKADIVVKCLIQLMKEQSNSSLQCLVKVLKRAGKQLMVKKVDISSILELLQEIQTNNILDIELKIRRMIKEVIELSNNKWMECNKTDLNHSSSLSDLKKQSFKNSFTKNSNTEEDKNEKLKTLLHVVIDKFLVDKVTPDQANYIVKYIPLDQHLNIITIGISYILDKPKNCRIKFGLLYAELIRLGAFSLTIFQNGFESILKEAEQFKIDVPLVYDYLAQVLVHLFEKDLLTFKDISKFCQLLKSDAKMQFFGTFISDVLAVKGRVSIKQNWQESEMDLSMFIDEQDSYRFLKNFGFFNIFTQKTAYYSSISAKTEKPKNSVQKSVDTKKQLDVNTIIIKKTVTTEENNNHRPVISNKPSQNIIAEKEAVPQNDIKKSICDTAAKAAACTSFNGHQGRANQCNLINHSLEVNNNYNNTPYYYPQRYYPRVSPVVQCQCYCNVYFPYTPSPALPGLVAPNYVSGFMQPHNSSKPLEKRPS